jgi:hypothetical protein
VFAVEKKQFIVSVNSNKLENVVLSKATELGLRFIGRAIQKGSLPELIFEGTIEQFNRLRDFKDSYYKR